MSTEFQIPSQNADTVKVVQVDVKAMLEIFKARRNEKLIPATIRSNEAGVPIV